MSHPTVGIEETTEGPRDASFDVGPLLARLANLVGATHTSRVAANCFVYRSSHVLRRLLFRRVENHLVTMLVNSTENRAVHSSKHERLS